MADITPPSSQYTDAIYDLGTKRIDKDEQYKLLIKAQLEIFNNKPVNRDYFNKGDRNTRPPGYCKSTKCRNHESGPVYSAELGPYVKYQCMNCLAENLCSARQQSTGPGVLVEFVYTNALKQNSNIFNQNILVDINGRDILINGNKVIGYWIKINKSESRDNIGWKIIVESEFKYSGKSIYLTGTHRGQIRGRHLCKNIYLGLDCESNHRDYIPSGFMAKSVPLGVPGWSESDRPGKEGIIEIKELCFACIYKMSKTRSPQVTNYRVSVVDITDQDIKPYLNMTKKPEKDRKQENKELKKHINELLDKVKRLEIENSQLRIVNSEYEANKLKYKLKL